MQKFHSAAAEASYTGLVKQTVTFKEDPETILDEFMEEFTEKDSYVAGNEERSREFEFDCDLEFKK